MCPSMGRNRSIREVPHTHTHTTRGKNPGSEKEEVSPLIPEAYWLQLLLEYKHFKAPCSLFKAPPRSWSSTGFPHVPYRTLLLKHGPRSWLQIPEDMLRRKDICVHFSNQHRVFEEPYLLDRIGRMSWRPCRL